MKGVKDNMDDTYMYDGEKPWEEALKAANKERIEEKTEVRDVTEIEEEKTTYLMPSEIAQFCMALSGKDEQGNGKSVISYMFFAAEDDEDSVPRNAIYGASNASVELSFNKQDPRFYLLDIIFRSYDDTELKLMWGRLQKFKRNWIEHPEKTWMFHIHLLEKKSVTVQTIERDRLVMADIFNPTYFNLSREVPNYLVPDTISSDGETYGGNMIRMLIPTELVSFEISEEIDTSLIKAEVQREIDATDYLDSITQLSEGKYNQE